MLFPELDEAENLIGMLGLGDTGVGVAQDAPLGVAGKKDQDALLAAATAGDIVLFQRLGECAFNSCASGVGGYAVKIQIKRRTIGARVESALRKSGLFDLLKPGRHETQVGLVIDAGTVSGQIGSFGDDIEAGKDSDCFVEHSAHDMALTFGAEQFQAE